MALRAVPAPVASTANQARMFAFSVLPTHIVVPQRRNARIVQQGKPQVPTQQVVQPALPGSTELGPARIPAQSVRLANTKTSPARLPVKAVIQAHIVRWDPVGVLNARQDGTNPTLVLALARHAPLVIGAIPKLAPAVKPVIQERTVPTRAQQDAAIVKPVNIPTKKARNAAYRVVQENSLQRKVLRPVMPARLEAFLHLQLQVAQCALRESMPMEVSALFVPSARLVGSPRRHVLPVPLEGTRMVCILRVKYVMLAKHNLTLLRRNVLYALQESTVVLPRVLALHVMRENILHLPLLRHALAARTGRLHPSQAQQNAPPVESTLTIMQHTLSVRTVPLARLQPQDPQDALAVRQENTLEAALA